ncbi:acyl CoA binding protein [Aureococcus anophagefferens]|nr:acyl CoA binding protein [Aureococcus anophagefferens]
MAALDDASAFDDACAAAKKLSPSTTDQLNLYGLYKQATQGDVATGRPYAWDMTGRAKWDAWKARAGLAAADARRAYVEAVAALAGGPAAGAATAPTARRRGRGAARRPRRARRPATRAEAPPGADAAQADDCGRAALHWAADVGSAGACEALLARGARVDASDDDGLTALSRGHVRARRRRLLLLAAGADPDAADDEGDTPARARSARDRRAAR